MAWEREKLAQQMGLRIEARSNKGGEWEGGFWRFNNSTASYRIAPGQDESCLDELKMSAGPKTKVPQLPVEVWNTNPVNPERAWDAVRDLCR